MVVFPQTTAVMRGAVEGGKMQIVEMTQIPAAGKLRVYTKDRTVTVEMFT